MLRKRNEYPKLITPKGVAIFPAVAEPDYKFKDDGEYHVRLRLAPDAEGLDEIVAQAEAIRDEAFEAKKAELEKAKKGALLKQLTKADIIREEVDQETGEPTGFVILRAALTAKVNIKNGWRAGESFEKKPDVFDARGTRLKNVPKVGSGSELKLAVVPMDYETDGGKVIGTRFELQAVQIIKLVTGGQRSASDYGFGEEDGDVIEDTGGFSDEAGGFEGGEDTDRDF
jgi:hypothetical protein